MVDEEIQRIADDFYLRAARAKAPQREKNAWVAAARRFFNPGDREPCRVCGKFQTIAQAHHLIPLEAQFDKGVRVPNHDFVWLCPNHHEVVHMFIKRSGRRILATTVDSDLSETEFNEILALTVIAIRGTGS
jgi:hypothetical protein